MDEDDKTFVKIIRKNQPIRELGTLASESVGHATRTSAERVLLPKRVNDVYFMRNLVMTLSKLRAIWNKD